MNPQVKDLQDQIDKLQAKLSDLEGSFFKNNFGSTQTFNKDCVFSSRLKIPHYDSAPTVSEVGDLIEVGGVAYICTIAGGTFTKIGSQ